MAKQTVSSFAQKVAKQEGKKKQINIAQIKEVIRVSNDLLDGDFYKLIRSK